MVFLLVVSTSKSCFRKIFFRGLVIFGKNRTANLFLVVFGYVGSEWIFFKEVPHYFPFQLSTPTIWLGSSAKLKIARFRIMAKTSSTYLNKMIWNRGHNFQFLFQTGKCLQNTVKFLSLLEDQNIIWSNLLKFCLWRFCLGPKTPTCTYT